MKRRTSNQALGAYLDHKKLGRELDIYHIDQTIGKGLLRAPLAAPKGTVIRDELRACFVTLRALCQVFDLEFAYG